MAKVVLISGSSSGIGEQTAYLFARGGDAVIITYHSDKEQGEQVAENCRELGAESVMSVRLDLLDDGSIIEAVRKAVDKYGRIDVLVNNAGVLKYKYLAEMSFDDISLQTRTNLEGMIKLTRECLPHLGECVVNIGSILAFLGRQNYTAYAASKFGVRGFTQALAREHRDLRVYAVHPKLTATKMVDFQGIDPKRVARIVYDAAENRYRVKSGGDIKVWEYLYGESWKPFFALKKIVGDIVKGRKQ